VLSSPNDDDVLGMAVIGAGYWGPNLVRNISASDSCHLRWVCDLDLDRARRAVGRYSTVSVTSDMEQILNDPRVSAVAVATPAHTHAAVALACLDAGKHVLVEKPLAWTVEDGRKLVASAAAKGLTLMCDHTYCYTSAVQEIRHLVRSGHLGDIFYVDSVRINLGLVQPDVDVFWDLAPHDLAILDFVLPQGRRPVSLSAVGADPLGTGQACIGYLTLKLEGDAIAHAHLNWLSPTKVRTTIIGGSDRMVVWDDLNPSQRVTVYDSGVSVAGQYGDAAVRENLFVSYRAGALSAPALPEREALRSVISEFVSSIRESRPPLTDGRAGLRVLELLEAVGASLVRGGAPVAIDTEPVVAQLGERA
jgi:predicted dehydrogenase